MTNLKESGRSPLGETDISVAQAMKAELLTAMMDVQQEIRLRAYEICCGRDSASATALDDWLKAEKEIRAKHAKKKTLLNRTF